MRFRPGRFMLHALAGLLLSVAHVGTATAAESAAAKGADAQILEDEWLVVRIAGQPAGRVHSTVVRRGGEVETRTWTLIKMERLGIPISQEVTATTRETTDGRLLGFSMIQNVAAQTVEIEGTLEGDKLHLVSRTMGQERRRTENWPEDAIYGYAVEAFVRAQPRTPGSTFTFKTYNPETEKFVDVTYEVGEARLIDILGKKVRATKSLIRGRYPGITPVEWRDAEGVVWKIEMGMMGISIDMLRTTREVAEATTRRPGRFDALVDLCVHAETRLARPREVSEALYQLRLKQGNISDLALDGPGQKIERESGDGAILLRVRSVTPDPERVLPHPIRDPEMASVLAPSTFVQSDDPEIVRVAREVASHVRSSHAAAKRLEQWVFRNMTKKGFDRGFASAKEVMQDRAGDCTEHAVLLCALLRAAGIPARGASGLLYFEMPRTGPAFAYHMWTEAYVGEWVPLDATLAGEFTDATHIRLAGMDLAGMSAGGGMIEMLQVFGRLEISIEEYTVAGRVTRPGEASPRTVVETRYRDLEYGVSFAVPAGWRILRAGDPGITERGAIACLVRTGGEEGKEGGERIALLASECPPGALLSETIERLGAMHKIESRKGVRLGGRAAVRVRYAKGRGAREAVVAKRVGTLYLLRLEPATPEGSAALTEVARSFRFE